MYTLEPGEIPSRTLTSKPLGFLVILSVVPMMIGSHFLCGRFGFVRVSVYRIPTLIGPTSWVVSWDRWVTELRSTRLRRSRVQNGWSGDKRLCGLGKPQEQVDRLPPPRDLIMDFTMTHTRFGRSNLHPIGQVYLNRPDPMTFIPVVVDTSDCIYDDFSRLLFLKAHREASALDNKLPDESGPFCFLRTACLSNL